jgi:alpha-glucosidase
METAGVSDRATESATAAATALARRPDAAPAPGDWWRRGVVYQIFPLTFMDASGDGIGDLPGITSRLDYVASLGVAAIWLSPIHPSPWIDSGYDVADYLDVHPRFGTLADFDRLVAEAHRRDLRVILDFVPNHTSDRHPWFVESRSSRDNPKRDWYIWRDPKPDGRPPNNWMSYFGPAWTFDKATGQSYFHQFRSEQPELNYDNPAVLAEMVNVLRFWLDRGVDGFRVDVIALLAKDPELRDEPPNPEFREGEALWFTNLHTGTEDQPAVHDIIRAFRRVLDEYPDRVLIGELDPIPNLMRYYGAANDESQLPFNFNLVNGLAWEPRAVRDAADAYDAAIPPGAWPNWVLGNHDRPRITARVGAAQARVAQLLVLTLRGTPFCYYGDELGMEHADIPPGLARDGVGGRDPFPGVSRDAFRTPMQWDASPNAGFCPPGVEPYLPLGRNWQRLNVAVEDGDAGSVLEFYRALLRLRSSDEALMVGAYQSLAADDAILAYERRAEGSRIVVGLNFSHEDAALDLGGVAAAGDLLLSTALDREGEISLAPLRLRADEGVVVRIRE